MLVQGLASKPELNGRLGTVLSYETGALHYGRYMVEVEGADATMALKPSNLRPPKPLLPGWVEVPTPEGTYYHEEASGTTSWDRPEAP